MTARPGVGDPGADRLGELVREGAVAALDAHLARALAELVPGSPAPVVLAAALVSGAAREGHSCVTLAALAAAGERAAGGLAPGPEPPALAALLEASPLVSDGTRATPLVLDRGRVYLHRHWEDERALAAALLQRASAAPPPIDAATARASLQRLFGPPPLAAPDGQRVAAVLAALRLLTVITGGPGTGKTSTVVRVVALLIEQALARGRPPPRVALLAPTGKAAARLAEAVRAAKRVLPVEAAVCAAIPDTAATLHRALGLGGASSRPRAATLAADLVVVDEASMVDLGLMRRLVAAVLPAARLILLGDRHQLASIEAGAVLADVSGPPSRPPYSERLARAAVAAFGEPLPGSGDGPGGLADSLVELTASHRFTEQGGIGRLAAAILAGDGDAAVAACDDAAVRLEPAIEAGPGAAFARRIAEGYAPYLGASDPAGALAALGRFRVLAAHRRGPAGIAGLVARIERELGAPRRPGSGGGAYHRRPVLVTENDPGLAVWNGDVGVTWAPQPDQPARVWLAGADGEPRALSPSRLPAHETAFAMSVHRSQGSELDAVVVVLPEPGSPLLTRELAYTAVTRARSRVTLFGGEASLRAAVARRVERATGLAELLWG